MVGIYCGLLKALILAASPARIANNDISRRLSRIPDENNHLTNLREEPLSGMAEGRYS